MKYITIQEVLGKHTTDQYCADCPHRNIQAQHAECKIFGYKNLGGYVETRVTRFDSFRLDICKRLESK